jgi:F0F1-type ATP synthase epsilon subunit
MIDDPNKSVAKARVINAEKQLLRARDSYEKAAAQVALDAALAQLEWARDVERG